MVTDRFQRNTIPVVVMTAVVLRFLLKKRRLETESPSELVSALHVATSPLIDSK
jgi:hypothetical protein